MDTLFPKIKTILVEKFNTSPDSVRENASFDEMDLDSLAHVEFGEVLSEYFDIAIDDDEFAQFATLEAVLEMLREKGVE